MTHEDIVRIHDPSTIRPLHAWVLVREEPPPTSTPSGLIVIPGTSEYQGRRSVIGRVIAGGLGRDKSGDWWEIPPPGSYVIYPILAHNPTTQKRFQAMIRDEDDDPKALYYFVHAMDLVVCIELEEGESLPLVS